MKTVTTLLSSLCLAGCAATGGAQTSSPPVGGTTTAGPSASVTSSPTPSATPTTSAQAVKAEVPRPRFSRPPVADRPVYTGLPVGAGGKPVVYLTFDDGPDVYGGTGDVAAELKKLKVPATFFVLGTLAQSPEGQTQLAALRQEGFNIGVHGWTHSDVRRWSGVEVSDMLTQTAQNITSATYASPTCFRPPYGSWSDTTLGATQGVGMSMLLWDVDPNDWAVANSSDPDKVSTNVISALHPGAVILLHDGAGHGANTAAALPRIVDEVRSRGWVFGSSCEMVDLP